MGQIVSLLFHKDSFGNKQPIKVDMLLNKETKTKTNQWSILIFKNSYATLKIIKKRICKIVEFAVPADRRIKLKECEKKDKYVDLARELKKLRNMKMTIVVIVIGAFVIYQRDLRVWIRWMLLTDRLIRPVWSPKYHHVHRCCVSEDVDTATSTQG